MTGLDRVRSRTAAESGSRSAAESGSRAAPDGTRALFSPVESRLPMGAVMFRCARCEQTSVLTLPRAAWALLPSVHLPLRRAHRSWLRCPACHRPSWVSIRFRLG